LIAVDGKLITILDFSLMEQKRHSMDIPTCSVG
jgi:hypothetical protein